MIKGLIERNPDVPVGTPVSSGINVPVRFLMENLDAGDRPNDFSGDFPTVAREQVLGLLERLTAQLVRDGQRRGRWTNPFRGGSCRSFPSRLEPARCSRWFGGMLEQGDAALRSRSSVRHPCRR